LFSLAGIGILAFATVMLVIGAVALIRCDRSAIPDVLRALSRFVGHPDHQVSAQPDQPGTPAERSGRHVSVRKGKP
jgi:hypothetical protein